MKYLIYSLSFTILISCSEIENIENKKNCDFEICENGRNNIDTLANELGVLKINNGKYYIEVTRSDPEPYKYYISCQENQVTLPETENYVKFSSYVKDPCSNEKASSTDSLSLNEIELIHPLIQESCEPVISQEGFDITKNDEKLTIHHLAMNEDCLHILVSYIGNCNQSPNLTLHSSGDILFGPVHIVVSLQGPINDDCNQKHYALLKYDLSPLWTNFTGTSIQEIILYFQSQGMLKIGYTKQE
jgi:hypothetical protein